MARCGHPAHGNDGGPQQQFDLQDSWSKGLAERPDLLQAKLNVEQQGIQLKYYRNQLFPELDLIGTYGFNGAGTEFSGTFNQFNQGNLHFTRMARS